MRDNLIKAGLEVSEIESFSDKSASWFNVEMGDYTQVFSFNHKGTKLNDVSLYKNEWVNVKNSKQIYISKK